ncbi:MAG: hypothetical protein OFPII_17000 [Osedax symbiont Rs1]|nr:MAG: hypothetical protein OFPII_17000 [Osedax symbiont Rs1]
MFYSAQMSTNSTHPVLNVITLSSAPDKIQAKASISSLQSRIQVDL